jgi:hypothetical protein
MTEFLEAFFDAVWRLMFWFLLLAIWGKLRDIERNTNK